MSAKEVKFGVDARDRMLRGVENRHQCWRRRQRHHRKDPREGSIFLRLRLANRRIRLSDLEGHHRPDQGGSCGNPKRSLGRSTSDHHRSHGGRSAEEERGRWRHAPGRRHGRYGLLSPTVQHSERPGGNAGSFSAAGKPGRAVQRSGPDMTSHDRHEAGSAKSHSV
jgi:hypothetical protein